MTSFFLIQAACYFDPSKVNEMKLDSSDIDNLKAFLFSNNGTIINLKAELPTYLSKAEDVSSTVSKTKW